MNNSDPHYLTNVDVARKLVRGNTGDVEMPMSAREEKRMRKRLAARVKKAHKKARDKDPGPQRNS